MTNQLRLNFVLSSFGKLFIAGGKAEGALKVNLFNETTITKIKIGVVGKITIEADENGNDKNPTAVEETFYESEECIFHSSDLKDVGDEDAQMIVFAVPLKNNLPPTVVVRGGSIKYYLYACLEEQFLDGTTQIINTQADISVASQVDCNTQPNHSKEKMVKSESVQSCLCILTQTNVTCLQINKRAFVPGDSIKVNAVVHNTTQHPFRYVQVALVQKVKLKYENHMVKSRRVVTEAMRGCLNPNEDPQMWCNQYLRIPPLPPTSYSKHLKVTYKLKLMTMKLNADDATSSKPVLSVPVFIGNLPEESTLKYFNQLPHGDILEGNLLSIPELYREYARAEPCIQPMEGSKFVPLYISYMTERAMENIELLDN